MPHLETDDLIKLYYARVKERCPGVDFEHFTNICKSVFRYVKSRMESPDLPVINVKYIGKFRVTSAKIKLLLDDLERTYKSGRQFAPLTEEEFQQRKAFYTTLYEKLSKEEQAEAAMDMRNPKNKAKYGNQELIIENDEDM